MATKDNSLSERIEARLGDQDTSLTEAVLTYLGVGVYFIWFLVPVIWLLLSSFKTSDIIRAQHLIIIPEAVNFTLQHYVTVLSNGQFRLFFINSVIIALSTSALTLVVSVLGAYSLSRFSFPGRNAILITFLSTKMLPLVLILIPFFLMMFTLGLVNSYLGIILAHSVRALPLALWLLKGFFDEIPIALDESARIGGCSHFQVIYHIILPLALPGIAVAGFYTFVTSWNDFLFVSILSQGTGTRTLPYGLYLFRGTNSINWGQTITAATITTLPSIAIFALVQNHVIEGLASGGMHGS